MGRAPCCDKTNVKRGPWSPEEDATLRSYLERHGTGGNWIALPHKAGLRRCGKSCRLRWLNYLRPDIKHGCFTQQEDNIICTLYNTIGSRWSVIASHLPGRTDNDVKNYWNTKLKKKLLLDVQQQQQQQQSTTTQDQTAPTTPKLPNPDPVLPAPVPKVVEAEEALLYTPNYLFSASAATGTGMEFSSSYDEWIRPDPNSFPIIMQSMANTTTTANGQQLRLQEVLPPEDGYSSTTTTSTSADHHSYCASTGGQYGTDDLFLQELLGFGSYSHEFLGGFGDLMVNAPLIYSSSSSSSSSTKPPQAGIIYQNHVTNYYS